MKDSSNYEQLLERAETALISRDFQLATRLYKSILKHNPANIEILEKLGSCYIKANQDSKAEDTFKIILKRDPSNFSALLNLGGIYRRLGNYKSSVTVLLAALKQDKNTTEVNYNLGHTYKLMGKLNEAAESFMSVIEENPTDVLAYNHLGAIQAARGEHLKALQTYKKGLQVDPNHPILHYNSAHSLIELKRYDEAMASYENVFRTKPGWAEATEGYADLLIANHNAEKAEEVVRHALLINPKNEKLKTKLGKVFIELGDTESAEAEYKTVYSKDSTNKNAIDGLAKVYEKTNRNAEAARLLEKLINLDPKNKNAKIRYCKVLIKLNKLKQAIAQINKFKAVNPNDVELLNLEAQYFVRTDEENKELDCYVKIKTLDPDYYLYLYDCGKQHVEMGNYSKAKLLLSKFLGYEPRNADGLHALGENAENQQYFDEALRFFKEALSIEPKNPLYLESLSRISSKSKLDAESVEMVTNVINQTTQEAPAEMLKESLQLYEQSINSFEPKPDILEEEPNLNLEESGFDYEEPDYDEFKTTTEGQFDDLLTLDMSEEINFENYDDDTIDLQDVPEFENPKRSDLSDLIDDDLPLEFVPTKQQESGLGNYTDFLGSNTPPVEEKEDIEVSGSYGYDEEIRLPNTKEVELKGTQLPPPPMPYYPPYYPQPAMNYPMQGFANMQPPVPPAPPEPPIEEEPVVKEALEENEALQEVPAIEDFDGEDVLIEDDMPEMNDALDEELIGDDDALIEDDMPEMDDALDEELIGEDVLIEDDMPEMNDALDEELIGDDDALEETGEFENDTLDDDNSLAEGEPALEDTLSIDDMLDEEEPVIAEELPEDILQDAPFTNEYLEEDAPQEEPAIELDTLDEDTDAENTLADTEPLDENTLADTEPLDENTLADDDAFGIQDLDQEEIRPYQAVLDDILNDEQPASEDTLEDDTLATDDATKTKEEIICDTVSVIVDKTLEKEENNKFKNTADMVNKVRKTYAKLPEAKREDLMSSLKRLKLDYVSERIKSKPGLLSAATAILSTEKEKTQTKSEPLEEKPKTKGKGLLKLISSFGKIFPFFFKNKKN